MNSQLHDVAFLGIEKDCEDLLRKGANVEAKDEDGFAPLHKAARNGHTRTCEILLKYKANVDAKDKHDHIPLHFAAMNGHSETCELLLRHTANVNATNIQGDVALHYAALKGEHKTCEVLLRYKADANAVSNFGVAAVHRAALSGSPDTCEVLLKYNADVNIRNSSHGQGTSSLHLAASKGYAKVCEVLLRYKADVNIADDHEWTALHVASFNGHTKTCEELLKHGADVHVKDLLGVMPLHASSMNGHNETCQILLKYKADVNAGCNDGSTSMHLAAFHGYPQTCELLLKHDADINLKDSEGNDALQYAAHSGHSEICELLLKYGAIATEKYLKAECEKVMRVCSEPMDTMTIILCGPKGSGKTSLKTTLVHDRTHLQDELYVATRGIHISTENIADMGKFRIFDFAGHDSYRVAQCRFLSLKNSVIIVVYNMAEKARLQDLQHWLALVKSVQVKHKRTKIIIVASHLDMIEDLEKGWEMIQADLTEMRRLFGEFLDICHDIGIGADVRVLDEVGIPMLKQILESSTEQLKERHLLPPICKLIMDQCPRLYNPKVPLLPLTIFHKQVKSIANNRLRDIDNFIEEEALYSVTAHLVDIGELYIAEAPNKDEESLVVMDIHWLYNTILAKLFGEKESTAKIFNKQAIAATELRGFFEECNTDVDFTILLLDYLNIVFPIDEGIYVIPSKLPSSTSVTHLDIQKESAEFYGIRFECIDKANVFAADLFPWIQRHVCDNIPNAQERSNSSPNGIKIYGDITQVLCLTDEDKGIDIAVVCQNEKDRGLASKHLKRLTHLVESLLQKHSPGTDTRKLLLSLQTLTKESTLREAVAFEETALIKAENGDGIVVHRHLPITAKMENLICQGFDTMFIEDCGGQCGWEWIPISVQERLYPLLDKLDPFKRDYRALAEIFGISDDELLQLTQLCDSLNQSLTGRILQEVSSRRRKERSKLTIQEVLTTLRHPGIVDNPHGAIILQQMLKDTGHEECNRSAQYDWAISPDIILWRGVVRRTHESLRQTMIASRIMPYFLDESVLSENDEKELKITETTKGHLEAADELLFKLVQVQKVDWHEALLRGLKREHPTLAAVLNEEREKLLKKDDTGLSKRATAQGSSENVIDQIKPDPLGQYFEYEVQAASPVPGQLGRDCYNMWESANKGLAYILNIEEFKKNGREVQEMYREGSEVDFRNIQHLFTQLGYKILDSNLHVNLSAQEIRDSLDRFVASFSEFTEARSSSVAVLMSHGNKRTIIGSDCEEVPMSDIVNKFEVTDQHPLFGKPKLFFIQACRGTRRMQTTLVNTRTDAAQSQDDYQDDENQSVHTSHVIRSTNLDMYLAYSTTHGCRSTRNPEKGSWYIRALTEVFLARAHIDNLDVLLRKVRGRVVTMESQIPGEKGQSVILRQTPEDTHTMTKTFYFLPKYPPQ